MTKGQYYSDKLSASHLQRCYEIASPRIKQYLEAEIKYTLEQLKKTDVVLELGCGYGRVLKRIAVKANTIYGVDTSESSLTMAKEYLKSNKWKSIREWALIFWGYRCAVCNSKERVEVHHRTY